MASRSSCPRRARCAASHRRPASSTRNASAGALPCLLGEQSPEEPCDLTQRRPAGRPPGRRLYACVVVGGGVHVVGHHPAVGLLDELEAANLDAVPAREGQVLADDRMIEVIAQGEQVGLIGLAGLAGLTGLTGLVGLAGLTGLTGLARLAGLTGRTGLTGLTGLAGLAGLTDGTGIGRAQVESASLGVRSDRVHELTAHDLNPRDERLRGLHVLLEQRDPVNRSGVV